MIQISTQPGSGVIDAPRVAGSTPQIFAEFAIAMAQLLAPATGGTAPVVPVGVALGERQDPAVPGKILPVDGAPDLIMLPEAPVGADTPVLVATPRKAEGSPAVDISVATVSAPVIADTKPGQRKADVPIAKSAMPEPIMLATSGKKVDEEPAPPIPSKRKRATTTDPIAAAPMVTDPVPPVAPRAPAIATQAVASPAPKLDTGTPDSAVQSLAAPTPQAASPAPEGDPIGTVPRLAEARPTAVEPARNAADPQPIVPKPANPEAPADSVARPTFRAEARAEQVTLRAATAAPRETPDIQPAAARPAGQAFAAAMFAARAAEPNRKDGAIDLSAAFPLSGTASPAPLAVHATAQAHGAPLDTRRDDWMTGMIERIELVRDEGGARQAHIRLAPDALGGVDVAIRHDRGTVHVQITADTPAARAILADAAPRLAEMAESRGLKFGGGDAGQAQTQSDARDPRQPQAPASTRNATAANEDSTTDEDTRIA